MDDNKKVVINNDGGSRGNPGPSAFACVFFVEDRHYKSYSEFLGQKTNNEAEYAGLIFALKKAKALFGKDKIKTMDLEILSDSELLVNQMSGKYKIKEPHIQKLFLLAWNLKIDFANVSFIVIPREQNKTADALLNETLDKQQKENSQKLI